MSRPEGIHMVAAQLVFKPTADLQPGEYFKDPSMRWYRVVSAPQPGTLSYTWALRVLCRTGEQADLVVYSTRVQALLLGQVPTTWLPSALRREAGRIRAKGQAMIDKADGIDALAREMGGDSEQQKNDHHPEGR
jgi:hypothetical protein